MAPVTLDTSFLRKANVNLSVLAWTLLHPHTRLSIMTALVWADSMAVESCFRRRVGEEFSTGQGCGCGSVVPSVPPVRLLLMLDHSGTQVSSLSLSLSVREGTELGPPSCIYVAIPAVIKASPSTYSQPRFVVGWAIVGCGMSSNWHLFFRAGISRSVPVGLCHDARVLSVCVCVVPLEYGECQWRTSWPCACLGVLCIVKDQDNGRPDLPTPTRVI